MEGGPSFGIGRHVQQLAAHVGAVVREEHRQQVVDDLDLRTELRLGVAAQAAAAADTAAAAAAADPDDGSTATAAGAGTRDGAGSPGAGSAADDAAAGRRAVRVDARREAHHRGRVLLCVSNQIRKLSSEYP